MGLFRKNEKKKGSKNDLLSEEIFGYMQSEGFFPEMEEKDKGETDVSRIHFKFQGTNVTLETAEGNYVRIVMGFDLSHSNTDYFNLQCAASQIMYEMKAVKPHPEIFRQMIADTGIRPEESLFIDDSAANIETGKALGFNTYLAAPHEDFRSLFSQYEPFTKD